MIGYLAYSINFLTNIVIKVSYLHAYTEASLISLTAAASTIFLITNFLIALSLGTQRAQLVHLTALTWPRPCLARPPLRRLRVWKQKSSFHEATCSIWQSDACFRIEPSRNITHCTVNYLFKALDILFWLIISYMHYLVYFNLKSLRTMFLTSESQDRKRWKRTFYHRQLTQQWWHWPTSYHSMNVTNSNNSVKYFLQLEDAFLVTKLIINQITI